MSLLIDIGNSRIKWLLHDSVKNEFCAAGEALYDKTNLQELFYKHWGDFSNINRVLVSSVSNSHTVASLDTWVTKVWQLKTEYAKTEMFSHGVHNAYADYTRLGVDRWMSIIAAWHRFQSHKKTICVVDCGTATTVDTISETGNHLGGVIFPGYTMMQEALISNASGINVVRKIMPSYNLANTTEQGINSGCSFATTATIDRLVNLIKDDYGDKIKCIITGGNAKLFVTQLANKFEYEPNLVLHGLAIFADIL